jgi:site-specific DNA-methyltransferase (adenine-specific)
MSHLYLGDCLEVMAGMEPDSVDAVVTDPPYGLGFMGKAWDGMPPGPETAAAMLRVLKPAHYLVAFGGTRTHHRLMCALEDAGFEIRDTLMWLYGSGFPKGKGQLKPAWEPIVLCRKPGGKVRALGIDECRVETADNLNGGAYAENGTERDDGWGMQRGQAGEYQQPAGRWPANLILDEEAGAMLDGQSGDIHGGGPEKRSGIGYGSSAQGQDGLERRDEVGGASRFFYCPKASRAERNEGCEGQEARVAQEYGMVTAVDDRPGSTQGERTNTPQANHHPTVKPVDLMRWLVRLMSPEGGTVLDPFTGSGTTGVACALERREFIGIEREAEYLEIAKARINAHERQGVLI